MSATVKWETKAQAAPVGIGFKLSVSVDVLPADGQITWGLAKGKGTFRANTTAVDQDTLIADAFITVDSADKGDLTITAAADGQPSVSHNITFSEWDNPDGTTKSTTTEVKTSAELAPVVGYDGHTLYNDDTIVEFRIGLFDYKGDPIVGGEVRWSYEPNGNGISPRNGTKVGEQYPPLDGAGKDDLWYGSATGADGYARIKVAASRTWAVTMTAQVMGAKGLEWAPGAGTTYFISPNDPTPQLMIEPVTVDLDDGVLQLYSDTWVAHMPDPVSKPWGTEEFSSFFYIRGQGDHLLFTDKAPEDLNGNYPEPTAYLYNKSETENLKPHNTPILYSQNKRTAEIYMSGPLSWGTRGEIRNAPPPNNPPQVNRQQGYPWARVGDDTFTLGLYTWVGTADVLRWGGLPLIIDMAIPGVDDDKYYLFFVVYLNGANPPNAAAITWPPVDSPANKLLPVAKANTSYKVMIPENKVFGYAPVATGQGSPLYVDFYIAPKDKIQPTEANRTSWLYAGGWPSYRLNT